MPRKPLPDHLRRPVGRPSVYPWDSWLDGRQHDIEPEVDFDCTVDSIRQQIYAAARARGVKVSVRRIHNGLRMQVDLQKERTGSSAKYDWDNLLDGKEHVLQVGKDIKAQPYSFRIYARSVARERGLRLITRTTGNIILVRAEPKDAPRATPVDPLLAEQPFELEDPS